MQTLALLRTRGYDVRLLIVGDGPQYTALQADIERQGLSPYVHFTGAVLPEQVPEWLAQMYVAVAPYPNMDGFYFSPLKIYEYMAAGLPIIATRVGHLATVVEHDYNGILVEAENPEKMADAVALLLNEPAKTEKLGAAARLTAEREHSWLAVVDRILSIATTAKP